MSERRLVTGEDGVPADEVLRGILRDESEGKHLRAAIKELEDNPSLVNSPDRVVAHHAKKFLEAKREADRKEAQHKLFLARQQMAEQTKMARYEIDEYLYASLPNHGLNGPISPNETDPERIRKWHDALDEVKIQFYPRLMKVFRKR